MVCMFFERNTIEILIYRLDVWVANDLLIFFLPLFFSSIANLRHLRYHLLIFFWSRCQSVNIIPINKLSFIVLCLNTVDPVLSEQVCAK